MCTEGGLKEYAERIECFKFALENWRTTNIKMASSWPAEVLMEKSYNVWYLLGDRYISLGPVDFCSKSLNGYIANFRHLEPGFPDYS